MTHQDRLPERAAPAAPRRIIHDPEAKGRTQRLCDATALAESEIKSALAAARCGIRRTPGEKPAGRPPERDWLLVASQNNPTLQRLLLATSLRTGVSVVELRSQRRNKQIVRARMIFMALAKQLTSYSLPQIGRWVGGKDHSTVLHAIRTVAENNDYFQPEFGELRKAFLWEDSAP